MSDNYIIVRGYDISNLQKQVNDKMKDGYIPVGGIFAKEFVFDNMAAKYSKKFSSPEFFQSMMKSPIQSGVNNY
tara:strand:- start:130 stop:351 length:222 start_codon:yes stop_codon:yes gene_type:complete